ncbi:MAG: hypothetical protein KGP14_10075 [Betaproteobacteria bacterium]|nr:hypothetical protein [Betaproteobacteria bacterium]
MKTNLSLIVAIALLASAAPAQPQAMAQPKPDAAQADAEPEIIVTGFSKPFKLTGKQLVRAQQAFVAKRSEFAPDSQLYFRVASQDGSSIEGLDLYLKNGDEIIDLPLDSQSRFIVPALSNKDWTLYANRGRKALSVTPSILSPGTSDLNRRLGDLRLQCNVYWAMLSPETSIFARALFSSAGGCKSGKFGYYVNTERAIASGSVSNGGTSIPIRLWGDHRYAAPIGEKRMPNDARVVLQPA